MSTLQALDREIRHFHLFAGLGGGARGFGRASVALGPVQARFRCLGGIDVDAAAVRDFGRLAGVPGTVLDLFDAEQFVAFHGRPPPPGWREAAPADIQAAAGGERPHIVFLSAPCKGFSGLLSDTRSSSARYQALNALTLRGMLLMLEAWAGDPPELVVFENVPRIATRGRALLDRIGAMLRAFGYAVAETTHDCGQLGNLAQSRKRFLLVARHQAKVPPFLYEPPQQPLRGVGEVLDRLPLPGDVAAGGPMHRVPALQWRTWVRLAFVRAGGDWRSLNELRVAEGVLSDYAIAPDTAWHDGTLGVRSWSEPSGVVTSKAKPHTGCFSVADPRYEATGEYGQLGVQTWHDPASTVRNVKSPIQGRFSVADPRAPEGAHLSKYRVTGLAEAAGSVIASSTTGQGAYAVADPRHDGAAKYNNCYRIVPWLSSAPTVTAGSGPSAGGLAVADPGYRWHAGASTSKLRVTEWDGVSRCVTGSQQVASGAQAVADPRSCLSVKRDAFATGGHYGVVGWTSSRGAVTGAGRHDNGANSVADPRPALALDDGAMPQPDDRLVCRIRALDGTWHRPFTTLELAALQSLVDPEEMLELDGLSDAAWRERIGNAVPPAAAQAIAETMGRTLLLAWSGEGFALSAVPIWVRPVAVALAISDLNPGYCG